MYVLPLAGRPTITSTSRSPFVPARVVAGAACTCGVGLNELVSKRGRFSELGVSGAVVAMVDVLLYTGRYVTYFTNYTCLLFRSDYDQLRSHLACSVALVLKLCVC
jgi:hypothetical protein